MTDKANNLQLFAELEKLERTDDDFLSATEKLREVALSFLNEKYDLQVVLDAKDKVQALGEYLVKKVKARESKLAAQNNIAEIRLRYERQIGQLLSIMKAQGQLVQGGWQGNQYQKVATSQREGATLKDIGITFSQSFRWQRMASLPDAEFEDAILTAKENLWELTSADVLRRAPPRPGGGNDGGGNGSVGSEPESSEPEPPLDDGGFRGEFTVYHVSPDKHLLVLIVQPDLLQAVGQGQKGNYVIYLGGGETE
jgi:hypothetical protein